MKVLIVDDYSTMRRLIRKLLTQIGYADVDEAEDGIEALGKLSTGEYGLVISDWHMEPMSGYELLKQARADEKLSKIPFLMVTAESKLESVTRMNGEVQHYIVKPFGADALRAKISIALMAAGTA